MLSVCFAVVAGRKRALGIKEVQMQELIEIALLAFRECRAICESPPPI
jgi:hypothetical protein